MAFDNQSPLRYLPVHAIAFPLMCAVVFSMSLPAKEARYVYDADWPGKAAGISWGSDDVPGVAVDMGNDLVYVLVRGNPAVRVYKTDGTWVRSWNPRQVGAVHGIELGPDGNVWIVDYIGNIVAKYTPEGTHIMTLGVFGQAGMDANHFNGPTDIAFTGDGASFYVSDGYGNKRVAFFTIDGKYVGMWGSANAGAGPGEFGNPHSIAIIDSMVFVADRENGRIQSFDLHGKFIKQWSGMVIPWGIEAWGGKIWAAGSALKERFNGDIVPVRQDVVCFSTSGEVLGSYVIPIGQGLGQVYWLHAIDLDRHGNLYLVDVRGRHAQKWILDQPGCPDKAYIEFNPDRTSDDAGLCVRRKGTDTVSTSYFKKHHDLDTKVSIRNQDNGFFIALPEKTAWRTRVVDMHGRTVWSALTMGRGVLVPADCFPAGVYAVTVTTGQGGSPGDIRTVMLRR